VLSYLKIIKYKVTDSKIYAKLLITLLNDTILPI
jgi:hypothetical protein